MGPFFRETLIFKDRKDAGQQLAKALSKYDHAKDSIIIALPRGGVVVAQEIAMMLKLSLDIVSPRKIGAPFNPEFAIGAITETGEGVFSDSVIEDYGISKEYLQRTIEEEKEKAKWRLDVYRGERPPRNLENKRVILVDDGIATGSTMLAAIKTVKAERAREIIVAVPVAPPDTIQKIRKQVDEVICLNVSANFFAVGQFYEEFDQTSDKEVIDILKAAS